jgi:hypothetical protein
MKKILMCATALFAVLALPQMAEAKGGGHGGGGGHFGGGHFGGGHFGGGGFRHFGYGFGNPYFYGYPYGYAYYYDDDDYGYPSCYPQLRRVHTKHGWRTRRVTVCTQ